MLIPKKKSGGSFGADGRRLSGHTTKTLTNSAKKRPADSASGGASNRLLNPGIRLKTKSTRVMCGLNNVMSKGFVRPMTKRRSYDERAETGLKMSSLGQKKRMDGMARLMARAGRGLMFKLKESAVNPEEEDEYDSDASEDPKKKEKPFEPLMVWQSPFEGGEAIGLPPVVTTEMQPDEYGIERPVQVLKPAPASEYNKKSAFVPPVLAKWLRPHQREGVKFCYECVMGLKDFKGNGCILADDMGLGKTLQSVTLLYTLLKTSITKDNAPTVKRVIVICPCSLVKNWDNEFVKWLGPGVVKSLPIADGDRKTVQKNIDTFVKTKMFNVLIASYECIRAHVGRLTKYKDCCDLMICDEAHRLKNSENQTSRALNSIPVKKRILLTGTPMQNHLEEFFAMVDFTNPGVLGTQEEFRRKILSPILRGREPDATEKQVEKMMNIQNEMSQLVSKFILRRTNTLNAKHLPPKLVQVVCCKLTDIQLNMYQHLINSKAAQHVLDGKQVNCLSSIQALMKLANHPSLIVEDDGMGGGKGRGGRKASQKKISYNEDDTKSSAAPGAEGVAKFLPDAGGGGSARYGGAPVHPEWSGKMFVLYRLIREMRKPGNGGDKIVIISNYTQTLDLIGRMCRQNTWGFCRLDGSIGMKKRQKMVDEFNDPHSSLICFLLSSKAGGCGINLIGANRLVLFDPDWNPAVDKQAAARCWRDGQKKRCFTYRFLATGTVEEKIFQRQLSKEGLQSVVDDKEQVNALSTKDLRNLFKIRTDTPSDTHDKLRCERCKLIADNAEEDATKVLPKKLKACEGLLQKMIQHEDSIKFRQPLNPDEEEGTTKEEYENLVKQPMDLQTIQTKLGNSSYKSVSEFSKDVNRIFSNVMKVWSPGQEIADVSRRLQSWWVQEWTSLVPVLMSMKADPEDGQDQEDTSMMCMEATKPDDTADERGTDFQEQIGMPDEENMRDWSHHHSADTVDDPIFRAAMKGYDNVSFVFGLEVTWSLIQQRQEEEEEKAAMQELERMGSCAGDDEDDEEDDDEEEDEDNADCVDEIDDDGIEIDDDKESDNSVQLESDSEENEGGDVPSFESAASASKRRKIDEEE